MCKYATVYQIILICLTIIIQKQSTSAQAVTVKPGLCPTNKVAPLRRISNSGNRPRTIGAYYDLFFNDGPGNRPEEEESQEEDEDDCGYIGDYDENDLSSLAQNTQYTNNRQGHSNNKFFLGGPFNRPQAPQRPPQINPGYPFNPGYPVNTGYPQKPTYRPPDNGDRPQNPVPPMRPPYHSGGYFGSNQYRPPQQEYPSDNVKPIHEDTGENQLQYRPTVVGGFISQVVGFKPGTVPYRPNINHQGIYASSTNRYPNPYTRSTTVSPVQRPTRPNRRPKQRQMSSDGILSSFVDLFFK